jgi:amino acid transporter
MKPGETESRPPSERNGPVALSRELGLLQVTMIGIGAMIGAGIFVLIGLAAGKAGPALILVFALNGVIAAIVGAHYAELSSALPRAGGPYYWLGEAIGPAWGFLAGWLSWFANATACSLYALGFGSFAVELFRLAGTPLHRSGSTAIALGIALVLLAVNYRGARETGWTETVLTGLKLAILVCFSVFGVGVVLGREDLATAYTPFFPESAMGVFAAMGLIFIAFEGYEIITRSAEEVKNPSVNIPRAIFLCLGVSVTLYILLAFVLLGAVQPPQGQAIHEYLGTLGELGMAEAAAQVMPYGRVLLLTAGLASTASALNATIYSATRVSFAMGRGGGLPPVLGRIHPVRRTPYWATGASGLLIVAMIVALPIEEVAASASMMFLLVFVLVCYSVSALRKRRPELERPFRVPLVPYLSWIGVASGIGLSLALANLSAVAWLTALVWCAAGALIYSTSRRRGQSP